MKSTGVHWLSRRAWLSLLTASPVLAQVPYKGRASAPPSYDSPLPRGDGNAGRGEVLIGYFGPDRPEHARGGAMWMGACLAVEDANASGGYRGSPIRLVARWSDEVWRAGAAAIAKLVYEQPVCALIGGIDSSSTHLATQVAAKALLPVIDPVSTDETTNGAGVPWVFSWAPGNREIARWMNGQLSAAPYLLVAGTDHDSRMLANAFLRVASRPPVLRIDTSGMGHPGVPRDADQVVVIAPPACTRACAAAFPARTRMIAGPSASSRDCHAIARRLQHPALVCRNEDLWKRMEIRFAQPADDFAQLSYEATSTLIATIREEGPDREAIRVALTRKMAPDGRRQATGNCMDTKPNSAEGESE